jgi:hypothetical protein
MSPIAPTNAHDILLALLPEKYNYSDYKAEEVKPSYAAPFPTSPPLIKRQGHYITLTITRDYTTYTTTILLGNTFPSSPQITTSPSVQTSQLSHPGTPGVPTSTIAGIVVGSIAGFLLLVAIFYVYVLRSRQIRRKSKKRGRSRSSKSSSHGGGNICSIPDGASDILIKG